MSGLKTVFKSAAECHEYIAKLPLLLQAKGYISSSLDSTVELNNQTDIYVFFGGQYEQLDLKIRNQDWAYLEQGGWTYNSTKVAPRNFYEYQAASEKMLDYFENNGYPFAKIYLDSVQADRNRISAILNIDKGFIYRLDSIRIFGAGKISRNFIHRYLGIDKASVYNKARLGKINQRLLELPYLQQTQPWDLTMLNTGGTINLYLQPKKSNQINILAGFLPSNQQLGGKLLLTVDANLQLQNAFGTGENFGLIWQQIQPKSPRIHINYTQPYLFNSPFGSDFLFELFRRDSAFLNITGQLGLLYMLTADKTGKVILQSQRTNVLQVDTSGIKSSKRLPDIADVSSLNIGVDYNVANTDYRFNPRRGNEFTVSAIIGNKTVRKNTAIIQLKDQSFNYASLYDSIKLKVYQVRLSFKAAQYFKTGKQAVFKTGVNGGWYQSPSYFRNELFQIGGYKLLRGFDEESIFANRYLVATFEYRYLVGLNSNFFVFSDIGYSRNSILKKSNGYIGSGVGLSLETKGGIFNLSYAAGKRNDLSFDIKQSKIHFGYVSIF
jgi:outer membrane translocation and assembly module TamA